MSLVDPILRRTARRKAVIVAAALILAVWAVPHSMAQGVGQGQVRGEVVDENGDPEPKLVFWLVPADRSGNSKRQAKTNRKGVFQVNFLLSGLYTLEPEGDEVFVRHLAYEVRDGGGLLVDGSEGNVDPSRGVPPFRVSGGTQVVLRITVTDAATAKKISAGAALAAASGSLREVTARMQEGDYAAALKGVDTIIEGDEDVATAHFLRGEILVKLERLDEAEASLRRAREIDPELDGISGYLGMVLLTRAGRLWDRGDQQAATPMYREALECLERQIAIEPDNPRHLTNRAVALDRLGETDRLVEALEAVVAASPDNLDARVRLADVLSRSGRAEDAAKVLAGLPELDRSAASVLFNVAVAMFNEGKLESATLIAERVVAGDPEFPDPYRLLCRLRLAQGDRDGAIAAGERFLELVPPDDPRVSEEREMLKRLQAGSGPS